jgi:hypothetical protein
VTAGDECVVAVWVLDGALDGAAAGEDLDGAVALGRGVALGGGVATAGVTAGAACVAGGDFNHLT